MTADRRYVLACVVGALGAITGAILLEVLGTILFAITVAYVLVPVHGWLVRRGLSEWWAGIVAALVGFLGAIAVFSPIFVTLYLRRGELMDLLRGVPSELTIAAFGTSATIEAVEVRTWAIGWVRGIAVSTATAAPELAVKFALFGLVLFALLLRGDAAGRAVFAPIPRAYHDVATALAARARETLYAIYVLQLTTAAMTLVVGYPFFWMLGYENAFVLAMIAAILQFVPIIGPSLLVVPIAGYELLVVGDPIAATVVGVVGVLLVGWLPDVTVRPRLSRTTAGLPGSLYFVGFTGGLFTLGAIGIVVGPLVVALFTEAVELLADEVNATDPAADAFGGPGEPVATAGSEGRGPLEGSGGSGATGADVDVRPDDA